METQFPKDCEQWNNYDNERQWELSIDPEISDLSFKDKGKC